MTLKHTILGGSGFLGRHVVRALIKRGRDVSVVDVAPFPPLPEPLASPSWRHLDVFAASPRELDAVVAASDVLHLYAWSSIPETAAAEPLGDLVGNLGGTVKLLEAARRVGGRRIVFVSSGGTVYGPLRTVPAEETHPTSPISQHGVSKLAAEHYLSCYRALYGIDARIARLSNLYGPGQDPRRPQGAATAFVHRALAGQPVTLWGDGRVVRDFIHVEDAASALVALAEASTENLPSPPIVNIASGVGIDLNGIIAAIEAHLGRKISVDRQPARPIDLPVNVLDISLARATLKWSPTISVSDGIARLIDDLQALPTRAYSR